MIIEVEKKHLAANSYQSKDDSSLGFILPCVLEFQVSRIKC